MEAIPDEGTTKKNRFIFTFNYNFKKTQNIQTKENNSFSVSFTGRAG